MTAVLQEQQKGVLDIQEDGTVHAFREKRVDDSIPINAGYMVLSPEIFSYIDDDMTSFERDTMAKLAADEELMSYIHRGYWQCMDNLREKNLLEKIWQSGKAPWKKWND